MFLSIFIKSYVLQSLHNHMSYYTSTVNVVIFAGGEISRKCWQDISRGGNFHGTTPIFFIKAYWFYFRMEVIFAKKTKAQKNAKITPTRKFRCLQYRFGIWQGRAICSVIGCSYAILFPSSEFKSVLVR